MVDGRKIIEEIRALEKEQRVRFGKNALMRYTKNNEHIKQKEFHKCPKRNRWVFGGNRTGKTECGAAETVYLARGIHPFRENKRTDGWVVSLTREVQREVAQRKILRYLNPDWIADIVMLSGKRENPEGGVIDYIAVKNVFGTISTIGFKSCEMGRSKFAGASLDYVWFDEEPPADVYDECAMRVIDKKGLIYGTMTPLLGKTFVYDKIYVNATNDPEVWHEFMEWADNPYLDKQEIERITAAMSEEQLRSRRYGQFVSDDGLVYSEFSQNVHVIAPFDVPREWFDNISIDPGLKNPLSCHFYAVDYDGNVYVIAEHFQAGLSAREHCKAILALANKIGWQTDAKGRVRALIDSAATQRTLSAEKSVAELFFENGVMCDTRVDKDLYSGINRVKQYLNCDGKPRLFIFESCVNLIREFKTYCWAGDGKPKKVDDHALDELRYYLMTRPIAHKRVETLSEIALDKQRLIRRLKKRR